MINPVTVFIIHIFLLTWSLNLSCYNLSVSFVFSSYCILSGKEQASVPPVPSSGVPGDQLPGLWRKPRAHGGISVKVGLETSGQDGGIGRHIVPPRTTKRRTTTNLKTKNNQNWQKIKLYRCLTTKELKKKHSSRLVGWLETGSGAERTHGKVAAGGLGDPTFTCKINWEEQLGSETGHAGLQRGGNKASRPLTENTCGVCGGSGRNSQPHRRVPWRDPQGPRACTSSPTHSGISTRGVQFDCG